jgi:hypothetical protein
MAESRLSQVQAAAEELSVSDQLRLVEHLVQRIRERWFAGPIRNDDQVEQVSRDAAIQRELEWMESAFMRADWEG